MSQAAGVFICAVVRTDGGCDWYRVEVKDGVPEIMLDTRNAGCVLPF